MTTARKELDLRPRYHAREFLGEIGRGDEIVFGTDDESRRLDAPELTGAVKRQHGVDPARNYLHRRKGCEALSLGLAQPFIVATDPPARVEEQRRRLYIGVCAEPLQHLLAKREQPAEIGIGLRPGGREHDAGEP